MSWPQGEKKRPTGHGGIDPSDVGEQGYLCEFYRKSGGLDHLVFENL
jgi:hypothetical protein